MFVICDLELGISASDACCRRHRLNCYRSGDLTIAKKRKRKTKATPSPAASAPQPAPAPPERRKLVVALTVGEVGLALLLTWLLFSSNFAKHASDSIGLGAGDTFVLIAMGVCLAFFVFLLVFWQWRLSGRGRARLLVATFLSLLWSFCGLCWRDMSLRTAEVLGVGARPALEQIREETWAVSVTIGALVLGMLAVIAILGLERRRDPSGQGCAPEA